MNVQEFDMDVQALRKKHHLTEQIRVNQRLAQGEYLPINELLMLFDYELAEKLRNMVKDSFRLFMDAPGSSHNHQAWQGGYIDHVTETMNIAIVEYGAFCNLGRYFPFSVTDALLVMFLHDLEKPFKSQGSLSRCQCKFGADCVCPLPVKATKENRRKFRDDMIAEYGIELTVEQKNALRYVEGIPDSEYKPGERIMGELAAFCHTCDILSARLWHDWGRERSWGRVE